MTKLADIELNDLEMDIIGGNITKWVQDRVVEKIADLYVAKTADYFIRHEIKVNRGELKKAVLDKLANRIINNYLENGQVR